MYVVGVDGCPGGWIVVAYDEGAGSIEAARHRSFAEVLAAYPDAARIGVDIPIGLGEGVPRRADTEARRVLGPRRSSVFPAPDRRVVEAATYEEAGRLSRELTGRGVSVQAFGIYPKVADVDRCLTPALQDRVVEVHPEVCFWALAGRPMAFPKRTAEGFAERRALLAAEFGVAIPERRETARAAPPAGPDDLLDAIVAAWSAWRDALGIAGRLPAVPEVDGRGLRMEMVY